MTQLKTKFTNNTSDADKPIIILIHGLRGDHHGLQKIAQRLSRQFTVIAPDLPGSGVAPALKEHNLEGYILWLHQFCRRQPQKPYILGHSMGSIIVSHFVAQYPDDVQSKMVLLAPIFRSKVATRISKMNYYLLSIILAPLPSGPKHRLLASRPVSYCISHFLTYDKTQQKHIDQLHYQYSGRFASAQSLLADTKISMSKTTIFPPNKEILICFGLHDRLSPVRLARRKVENLDNVTYYEISNAGHLLNYEQPTAVARIITEFILPPPRPSDD